MANALSTLARGGADVGSPGTTTTTSASPLSDGIRSFVVGTRGRSHYPCSSGSRGSVVVDFTTFGVLRLTLRPASYAWRFALRARVDVSRTPATSRCSA
jgi:hypothetical protein